MNTNKIIDKSGHSFTRVFSHDKIENVNPVEYFKNYELQKRAIVYRDILFAENPLLTLGLKPDFFLKKAEEGLKDFFKKFEQTPVPPNLLKVLESNKKKDQIKLLKGVSFTTEELMALILASYNNYGFLFSRYTFENLPKGMEDKRLPQLFRLEENGEVEKVGDTDLTDGELKNVLLHRNVIVSNFFEKGEIWHCFFITYDSIAGKENWKDGQPHFHYISSAFGISKEDFIESMRSGKYRSTPVHIDLVDYGGEAV